MNGLSLPRLHAVTTSKILELEDLTERAVAIADVGDVAIHVRGPDLPGKFFAEVALELKETLRDRAALFVNDRVDIALAVRADGVQLPSHGLPVQAARKILGDQAWVGRSTHSVKEAREAHEGSADFVFLGHVWSTPSHSDTPPIGLEAITHSPHPKTIAIGGVTSQRVSECISAGAYGVAAVSALWLAEDPASAARAIMLSLPAQDLT